MNHKAISILVFLFIISNILFLPLNVVIAGISNKYSYLDSAAIPGYGVGEGSPAEAEKIIQYGKTDIIENQSNTPDTYTIFESSEPINGCNCVVFRLDDVQDYWLNNVQIDVLNKFIEKDAVLSLGIIPNYLGKDTKIVNKVIEGYESGVFEIAAHGFRHDNFSQLNEFQQNQKLDAAQDKLNLIFGTGSQVFIPPYNAFDEITLSALANNNFNILSAAEYTDNYPSFVADGLSDIKDDFGIYHLPESVGFEEYSAGNVSVRIPNEEILATIDNKIQAQGYAVVTLHFQTLATKANGIDLNETDIIQLNDLGELIDSVVENGHSIVPFGDVLLHNILTPTASPTLTEVPTPTPTPSPSLTPIPSPDPTALPTLIPSPSLSPSPIPTVLPSLSPTITPIPITPSPSLTTFPTPAPTVISKTGNSSGGSKRVLGLGTEKIFSDVKTDHAFYKYISSLKSQGDIGGYKDGYYYPDQAVTRGQMAKFIVNAFNFDINTEGISFIDVNMDKDSLGIYIQTLKNLGIVEGYKDGSFRPNIELTRGEASKFIVKAMEKKGVIIDVSFSNKFTDIKAGYTFYRYIVFLANSKTKANEVVISGYPDGEYKPEQILTRGEMAKIIYNSSQSI